MALLQPMLQHWAVVLFEDVLSDFDDQVRTNADNIGVEGGVMQLAEGQAVADPGFTFRMAVGEDVRGVEKLHVAQSANGAVAVSANDAHPKALLMKSAL